MVGKALFLSDLAFQNRPDLFLNSNSINDYALNWFVQHNYISFHKVSSDHIKKIHELYYHEK